MSASFLKLGALFNPQIPDFLYYAQRVAPNAARQAITANTAQTITLDTEVYDTGNYGSLLTNRITLQAGSYFINIGANITSPSGSNFCAQVYLWDVTNSKMVLSSSDNGIGINTSHAANSDGFITIQGSTEFELRVINGGAATDCVIGRTNETFTLSTAGLDERAFVKLWRFKETLSQTPIKIGGGNQWSSYAELRNLVALNAAGQTITANTLTTVELTNETSDEDGIVSLSANQFTLGAGVYYIEAELTKIMVSSGSGYNPMYTRIQNVTDGKIEIVSTLSPGNQQFTASPYDGISGEPTRLSGVIDISSSKTFELQLICPRGGTLGARVSDVLSTASSNCLGLVKIYKR
jgi:hypothetical protein